MNSIGSTLQKQAVIQLLHSNVCWLDEATNSLEKKAQLNFYVTNVIAAILSSLNLAHIESNLIEISSRHYGLLVLVFLGYLVVMILSISALSPSDYLAYPLDPDEETVKQWSELDRQRFYEKLTESWILIYRNNKKINENKGILVLWSQIFLVLDIVIVLLIWIETVT
ncbi:MAG: hypothetical protein OXG60_09145 [Chloroflexi bacterium]|nr:hypothetical protein [Chloroflexota bacterium]